MSYITEVGFLGTKAMLYTDVILVYMVLLPFLMLFSIWFAMKGKYGLHKFSQVLLWISTLGMLLLFYYEMYLVKIFDKIFMEGSGDLNQTFYIFIVHLVISLITFILWKSTILFAFADKKRRALPGLYSHSHKAAGKRVMIGTLFITITIVILYRALYVI